MPTKVKLSTNTVPAPKKVSIVLFYDNHGNILIQDRREMSKWGEEYGFFGGSVEEGESHKQALKRELREELELDKVDLELFKTYTHDNPILKTKIERAVYLAKGIPTKIVCHEGKPIKMKFSDTLNLKMFPGYDILLKEIHTFLKYQKRITES